LIEEKSLILVSSIKKQFNMIHLELIRNFAQ